MCRALSSLVAACPLLAIDLLGPLTAFVVRCAPANAPAASNATSNAKASGHGTIREGERDASVVAKEESSDSAASLIRQLLQM